MLGFKNFLLDEDGVGVVEMILIIVVLIAMVVLFRDRLESLISTIFDSIEKKADKV